MGSSTILVTGVEAAGRCPVALEQAGCLVGAGYSTISRSFAIDFAGSAVAGNVRVMGVVPINLGIGGRIDIRDETACGVGAIQNASICVLTRRGAIA